ncbi:MAG TPA: PA2169 family four-helix-bundle protein [Verrucomicrobiae bacterium]|nr:PA2169 family four-helix-bundle protein [Verrucomicrobiae bacterium]
MTHSRSADRLNDLLEVARDGERFYREAGSQARAPGLRGTFRKMAELRQRLMNDLADHVAARGARPSGERTLRGTSRQLYARLRARVARHDDSAWLAQVTAIEDRLLSSYERALARTPFGDAVRPILRRHLLTVRATHERMRLLCQRSLAA